MKYKISAKRADTGKWWTFGNIQPGTKGPRMGLKKTPELMAHINAVADGGYINFALFEDEKEKPKVEDYSQDLDDSLPF